MKDSSENPTYDDYEKSELFNEYFTSVFSDDNGVLPDCNKAVINIEMREINFTFEKVQKAIKKLKTKITKGPDGLSPLVIKNLKDSICLPLMLIFNASYNSGKLPLAWKSAHVMPVFKKGPSSAVSNYRPISLTCVCCRLMESIINDDMSSYLLN